MSSPEQQGRHLERHSWQLVYWAFAATVLCIAGNISIMSFKRSQSRPSHATNGLELQYASTYMGLERALHSSETPSSSSSTVNFPVAFGVVDSSAPEKIFLDAPHRVTPFGTHFPEDRKIIISPTVSSKVCPVSTRFPYSIH